MGSAGIRAAARRVGTATLLGAIPLALLVAFILVVTITPTPAAHPHAVDFHTFWDATRSYVAHENPYPRPEHLTEWSATVQQSFVYPPAVAAVLAPLALLPYDVAVVIFVPLLALAVAAALWLLGIRDWRCYGAVFAWPATLTSISIGTISPLLLLGFAVAWRWRDRRLIAGLAIGAVVVAKLFVWPLVIWLWFSGRRAAALVAAAFAVTVSAIAWSWIRFEGLTSYPEMLRTLGETEAPYGYSALWAIGGGTPATAVAAFVGCVAVAASARRRDDAGFALAVVASILLTPILWLHYLVLLAAALAIRSPRIGFAWLVPLVAWVTPQQGAYGDDWRAVVLLAVVSVTMLGLFGRSAQTRRQPAGSTLALMGTSESVPEPT